MTDRARYLEICKDPQLVALQCRWRILSHEWQELERWSSPVWRETLSQCCDVIRQMQARRRELGLHPTFGWPGDCEPGIGVILL